MISAEVAVLRDALISAGATNSEYQAIQWAMWIIARLEKERLFIVHEDSIDGG